jgi:predicted phage-related endonuclease
VKTLTSTQGTPEWHQARLGKVTSSRACDMLAMLKDGKTEAAGRRNLRTQLVLERITQQSQENGYQSFDMIRGKDMEGEAVTMYEALTATLVMPAGFLAHDDLMAGCSPDGVINDFEGLVEFKCPKAATHLEYLRGSIPHEYYKQIQHCLWITGAQWCDFVSYQPSFPEPLRLKIARVEASAIDLRAYELLVRIFLGEVEREVEEIMARTSVAV